jgi:hypothetical protein
MPPPVLPTYKSRVRKRHTKLRTPSILTSRWVVFGLLFGLTLFFSSSIYLGYKYIWHLSQRGAESSPKVMNDVETWAKTLEEKTREKFEAMKDVKMAHSMHNIIAKGQEAERNMMARGEGENLVPKDANKLKGER